VVTELEPDCDCCEPLEDELLPEELLPAEPLPELLPELLPDDPLAESLPPESLRELLPEEPLPESLADEPLPDEPEPSSEPLVALLAPPSSLWLCEPLDPDDVVPLAAVLEPPPLPRAATASQAAMKVASAPAATRRRRVRRRWLMGGVGSCMSRMVDPQPWILLGIRSGSRKSRDVGPDRRRRRRL
jgi:hypothetical protein